MLKSGKCGAIPLSPMTEVWWDGKEICWIIGILCKQASIDGFTLWTDRTNKNGNDLYWVSVEKHAEKINKVNSWKDAHYLKNGEMITHETLLQGMVNASPCYVLLHLLACPWLGIHQLLPALYKLKHKMMSITICKVSKNLAANVKQHMGRNQNRRLEESQCTEFRKNSKNKFQL